MKALLAIVLLAFSLNSFANHTPEHKAKKPAKVVKEVKPAKPAEPVKELKIPKRKKVVKQ